MTVVGFNITKIVAETKGTAKGKLSVTPKIKVTDVIVQDFPMSKDGNQKVIVAKFSCGFDYSNGSELTLEGNQLYLVPTKVADETEKLYKDTKKLPGTVAQKIMSAIFSKCQMVSIVLSKEIGLPCPVPLPKLSVNAEQKTE